MQTKPIRWFSRILKIYKPTVDSIVKYLKIESINGEYPIDALEKIRNFYATHDCKMFFSKITSAQNKEKLKIELEKNPEVVLLSSLINYDNQIHHWRLVALLRNRNIKVIKKKHVAYISKEDYLRIKPSIDDINNDIEHVRSHPQEEVFNYLQSIYKGVIIKNSRKVIPPQEIDIYLPDRNIGIEFNGTFWHSNLNDRIDRKYHYNKSIKAREQGIRLIQIYEYEWNNDLTREKLKSMLRIACGTPSTKIYARQCQIKEITNKEAKPFNELHHLQGHRNAQVTYGLYHKDTLVQLMSFSRTKYNRNLKDENSWEIIRGCPGSNNIVVGGVSKLFKHFIKDYNPTSVFSYCDFNKFDGRGYEAIGMQFIGYTGPDMKWVMPDYSVHSREPKLHKQLKEESIGQIWGAGSLKYLWEDKN